jgi:hypothetical protein
MMDKIYHCRRTYVPEFVIGSALKLFAAGEAAGCGLARSAIASF